MMRVSRSFADLEGAVRKELLRQMLVNGLLLPLAMLWVVGTLILTVAWPSPWLALAWTTLVLACGLPMARSALRSPEMRGLALQLVLAKALGVNQLAVDSRGSAREFVQRFAAIRFLVGRGDGPEEALFRRALQNLLDLLAFQVEALADAFAGATRRAEVGGEVGRVFAATQRLVAGGVERGTQRSRRLAAQLAEETDQALARLAARFAETPVHRGSPFSDRVIEDVPPELIDRCESLEVDFRRSEYDAGLDALHRLASQYERLLVVLGRRRESDPFAVAQLPHLANEAFQQGLSVLEDTLELAEAVRSPEKERLEREVKELEQDLAALQDEGEAFGPRRLREERLQSHRERLLSIQDQGFRLEELLHLCGRCEASLERTRADVVSFKRESSEMTVTDATETLRKTVELARDVQNELKRLTPR